MDRDFKPLNREEKKEANADPGEEEESGWEENKQEADKKTGREREREGGQGISIARKKEFGFEKGKGKEHWE